MCPALTDMGSAWRGKDLDRIVRGSCAAFFYARTRSVVSVTTLMNNRERPLLRDLRMSPRLALLPRLANSLLSVASVDVDYRLCQGRDCREDSDWSPRMRACVGEAIIELLGRAMDDVDLTVKGRQALVDETRCPCILSVMPL